MPLCTEIRRGKNNHRRTDYYWDECGLNIFLNVAMAETVPDEVWAKNGQTMKELVDDGKFVSLAEFGVYYLNTECPLWQRGEVVLKNDYTYDRGDDEGRQYTFKAGDVLKMWRD